LVMCMNPVHWSPCVWALPFQPSTNFLLSPPVSHVRFLFSLFLFQSSGAEQPASDGEESKPSAERDRAEAEPSANSKESALKLTEQSSSHTSPKSPWCTKEFCKRRTFCNRVFLVVVLLSTADACKETESSSEKGDAESPLAKMDDKENKPGAQAASDSRHSLVVGHHIDTSLKRVSLSFCRR